MKDDAFVKYISLRSNVSTYLNYNAFSADIISLRIVLKNNYGIEDRTVAAKNFAVPFMGAQLRPKSPHYTFSYLER